MSVFLIQRRSGLLAAALSVCVGTTVLGATTLRIVSYNISGDTTTFDTNGIPPNTPSTAVPNGPLNTVMQALGAEHLAGNAQPIDILSLQELANASLGTPNVTAQAIVNSLNTLYGAGTYAIDTLADATDSTLPGGGPSGLIYNTKTVSPVIAGNAALGTVGSSGAARQPLRFEFQPVGYGSNADFYLYDDHYKADSGATNATRRGVEADEVRQDADSLPANSHIIFTGDFNLAGGTGGSSTSGSAEVAYKDITAAPGSTLADGATALSEQASDPLSPFFTSFKTNSNTTSNIELYTESATNLTARFDLQLDSPAVVPGSAQAGLQLVPNTYMSFGNSYYVGSALSTTMTEGGAVTDSTNTGPLTDLTNRSAVLTALTQLTDHLPVVADYQLVGVSPIPEPGTLSLLICGGILTLRRRRR